MKNTKLSGNQPIFLDPEADRKYFRDLVKNPWIKKVDTLPDQINEYHEVLHPDSIASAKKALIKNLRSRQVFYPWKNTLVKILDERFFRILRASRNRNLISEAEQNKISRLKIGIAGLNVGNPGAVCMALEGVGHVFKLADFDTLSLSNLNRFRAGVCELGESKCELTARQMYEINPYLKIESFNKGIVKNNIKKFLLNPKIDILIEETDNLALKIEIREEAKKHRIPVLMVTGNGENVIIDVERYDLKQDTPILNGMLNDEVIKKIKLGPASFFEKIEMARDFIGKNFLTKRLVDSFAQVGKTLAGIPQLAEASFLRGAAICFVTRQIFLSKKVVSGRYYLKLEDIL